MPPPSTTTREGAPAANPSAIASWAASSSCAAVSRARSAPSAGSGASRAATPRSAVSIPVNERVITIARSSADGSARLTVPWRVISLPGRHVTVIVG